MRLKKIIITQFKNYSHSDFVFNERVIGICGLNGVGKTNLLDAVYYCCFTKSYFTRSDSMATQFDQDGFRLEADFEKGEETRKLVCINRGTGKKELLLNEVPYEKFSQHIGGFPAVMIAPDDILLITGGSEERRRYLDTVLSQLDPAYLHELIRYNKVLQQRNSLLKQFKENRTTDLALLDVLDEQLIEPGKFIFERRNMFTEKLIPAVARYYQRISGSKEQIGLKYQSQLQGQDLGQLLKQNRDKDMILQRSNAGIHKDDILLELNGQTFKLIASQGQRKSMLFALKLAEFEMLKAIKGFAPLLLLDDIFEKLDDERMKELLNWVCAENDGQVFITDTHRERLQHAFEHLGSQYQLIEL